MQAKKSKKVMQAKIKPNTVDRIFPKPVVSNLQEVKTRRKTKPPHTVGGMPPLKPPQKTPCTMAKQIRKENHKLSSTMQRGKLFLFCLTTTG